MIAEQKQLSTDRLADQLIAEYEANNKRDPAHESVMILDVDEMLAIYLDAYEGNKEIAAKSRRKFNEATSDEDRKRQEPVIARFSHHADDYRLLLSDQLRQRIGNIGEAIIVTCGRVIQIDTNKTGGAMILSVEPLEPDEAGNVDLDELLN